MAEFIGLVFALVLLIFALIPVLTFLRLGRLSRELEALIARVDRLERAASAAATAAASAVAAQPQSADAAAAASPTESATHVPTAAPTEAPGGRVDAEPLLHPSLPADIAAPPSIPPTPPPVVAPDSGPPEDLESRIGGRGLLYTGVLVLLLGVSFFLKYAFDNEWINETGRVILGAIGGVGLIAAGQRFAVRGLAAFGQALTGTGLAILYLAIYAALNYYQLIQPATAFVTMGFVTVLAGGLAHRVASQSLAFIAVGGGFLTPFLVGGTDPNQLTLLSYDAVLVVATMLLARHHLWLALNGASYVMTVFTLLAWGDTQYSDDIWLRTLLFLTLFVTLFLIILRETMKVSGVVALAVALLLSTAPLLYHIAAVVLAAGHPPAIHIYLIAFTAAGLWLTADPHRPWIRLLVLVGSFAPLFGSLTLPGGRSWLVPNIVTIVAVVALHLIAIIDRVARQEEKLTTPDLAGLHLSGLGLFALLFEALQPTYPESRGLLAALIATGSAGLWRAWRSADQLASLNAAALSFTLIAIGIAVQFDGPVVTIGWAAEGAAIAWVGVRVGSGAFQLGGMALLALAVNRLLNGYFDTPAVFTVIVNQRAFATMVIVGLVYALAWLFNHSHEPHAGRVRAALHVAGSVMTVLWITAEIQSYWDVRSDQANAYLYEQMMLSLAWGLYGATLIAFGMQRAYAPVRYIGMTILAITVLKVFFYDLWELGGIYRVIGFLGFGILLVLVSYLYQRGAFAARPSQSNDPAPHQDADASSPPVA